MEPSSDQRILNEPGCSEEPEMKKQQTCEEETEPCTEIFTDSAAVVALTTPEVKTCGTCHKSTTDWTPNNSSGVRCKLCNAFKSRMQRVFHKNEDVRTSWNELSQSARDEWLKAAEQHMGVKDLSKALQVHMDKSKLTTNEVKQGMEKVYCDSPDLAKRYKGKEEQLLRVKENAPKMYHPLRGVYLYEDYNITGSCSTSEHERTAVQLSCSKTIKDKPKPKPAGKSKRTADAAALTDDPQLNKKVKSTDEKRLEKMKETLQRQSEEADAAIQGDPEEHVPAPIRQNLKLKTKELQCMISDIDLVVSGDHSTMDTEAATKKTKDLLKRHKSTLVGFGKVRKQITMATQMAAVARNEPNPV